VLGLSDLVMFYIVATLSLRWVAVAAAAGPSSLVVWVIGLVTIFIPLALCVMELSSRYPQEGGMYVWSKQAFGDFSGFLTGWTYWISNLPYFPAILYFAASNALYVVGNKDKALQSSPTFFIMFSFAGLALALILNIMGLGIGKWLNNLGAIGAWLPVGLLLVAGAIAWHKVGSATRFDPASLRPTLSLSNAWLWAALLSGFTGAESASCLGGEIRDARRTIPRALLIAGVLITAGYLLGTMAMLVLLPHQQLNGLEGIMQALSSRGAQIGWHGLAPAVALLICIANLGGVSAYLAAMSRLPFVAGIDRYLPAAFGRLHPKWGTPHVSLIVQGVCSMIFVLLGQLGSTVQGAYQMLVSMTVITTFIPYLFMFAALVRLQGEPAEPQVIRILGGKPVATFIGILGFVATTIVIVASAIPDASEPHKAFAVAKTVLLSAVLFGGGAVLYWVGKVRGTRSNAVVVG
jgi:amino acid transporter